MVITGNAAITEPHHFTTFLRAHRQQTVLCLQLELAAAICYLGCQPASGHTPSSSRALQAAHQSLSVSTESRLTVKDSAEGDLSPCAVCVALIRCQSKASAQLRSCSSPSRSEQATVPCRMFPAAAWKRKHSRTREFPAVSSVFSITGTRPPQVPGGACQFLGVLFFS